MSNSKTWLPGSSLLSVSLVLMMACSSFEIDDGDDDAMLHTEGVSYHTPYQVTAGSESNFAPSLSPDGSFVVYTSDRLGNKDIWRKRTSGGYAVPLTRHSADDSAPVFSPDGDSVAFISRRFDAAGEVHVIPAKPDEDGERDSQVITNKDFEDTHPAWYPDSERLIFASRRAGETLAQLMTASLSDLTPKPLEDLQGSQPHVAPDGKQIVYVRQGALHLYNEETRARLQLTMGGLVQDGQPRFTPDGKKILFIRYQDDTNNDGTLDADDQPTLWELTLPPVPSLGGGQAGRGVAASPPGTQPTPLPPGASSDEIKKLESFALMPLTGADHAAYTPELRGERLYFAKQTGRGLDIYYLPAYGHIKLPPNINDIREQLGGKTYHEKTYALRKGSAVLYQAGHMRDAAELAFWELAWLVDSRRKLEAAWFREKLKVNFPDQGEIQALADIRMQSLAFADEAFPEREGELLASARERISHLFEPLEQLYKQGVGNHWPRVAGEARYQQGRLRASLGDYFAAQTDFVAVAHEFKDNRKLAANAELSLAQVMPHISSREAATKKCMELIAAYPDERQASRKAAELAVDLAEKSEEPTASLLALREQAEGLPLLQATAHRRIADRFINESKELVAANELRQIVDSYPDSPQLTIEAADTLAYLVETQGRVEEAESILAKLNTRFANATPPLRRRARDLYLDLLVRKGEKQLQTGTYAEALASFKQVLSIDPEHIGANRGQIDAAYQLGTLGELWDEWDKQGGALTARALYRQGYATTYRIDETRSLGGKLTAIDDAIELLEASREHDDQQPATHQTLGWLYHQKHYWNERYEADGGFAAYFGRGWNTITTTFIDISFDLRVLNFFASDEPAWLELSIDSYQAASALSEKTSPEYGHIALNLAHSYYMLGNHKKALHYYLERIGLLGILPVRHPSAEAMLWQRAGRSAFQVGELSLAASLQNKALTNWETLNAGEQINYAMDALALTMREQGAYELAAELYQKLVKLQKGASASPNQIRSLINLAYCRLQMEEFTAASRLLAEAETALNTPAPRPREDDDDAKAAPAPASPTPQTASTLPEPNDRGSAANDKLLLAGPAQSLDYQAEDVPVNKDFYYEHMLLVETLRGSVYQEQGQSDNLLASYQRKAAILKARKEWGEEEGGKGKTYQVFELSILYNQLGNLELRLGRLDLAKAYFQQALAYSEELPQSKSGVSEESLLNQINLAKVDLQYAETGQAQTADLKELQSRLLGLATKINQQAADKKSPEQPPSLAKVFSLLGLVALYLPPADRQAPPPPYTPVVEGEPALPPAANPQSVDPLSSALAMWQRQQADLSTLRSPLLAAAGQQEFAVDDELAPLFRSFRRQVSSSASAYWPYLAQKGKWLEAVVALEAAQAEGGQLNQRSERLLAREVFEHYLEALPEAQVLTGLLRYQRFKVRDLVARSLEAPKTFFATALPPAVPGSGTTVESAAPAPDKKGGEANAALASLLAPQDLSQVQASLTAAQGILTVHRAITSGKTWAVLVKKTGVHLAEATIPAAERLGLEPYRRLFARLPLQGLRGLYLVPSEELYRLDWEGALLRDPVRALSFLPSLDALPYLRGKEKTAKILIAQLGRMPAASANQAVGANQTTNANQAASASQAANPAAPQPNQALLALTYDGPKKGLTAGDELNLFHIITARTPLNLNGIAPGQSFWSMLPYQTATPPAALNQLSLQEWSQLKLKQSAVVVFPNVRQLYDSSFAYEGEDAWLALAYAVFQAGVPSIALGHPSAEALARLRARPTNQSTATEAPHSVQAEVELPPAFFQSLMRKSVATSIAEHRLGLRSVGLMAGAAAHREAAEEAMSRHQEGFEDASSDNQWGEATSELLAMLYYQKLSGKEDAYWKSMPQLVMMFYRLQKFAYALRLQEVVVHHLASAEGGKANHAAALVLAATLALLAEEHDKSAAFLAQAEAYYLPEEEWTQMANIWHYRALNAEKQQQYDKAIAAYEESIKFYEKDGATKDIANKYKAIAGIYQVRLSQFEKALTYLDKAEALFKQENDDKALAELKIERANIYISLDRAKQAIALLSEVLATIAKEDATVAWLRTSQNLANAQLRAGAYTDAQAGNTSTLETLAGLSPDNAKVPAATQKLLLVDALNLRAMVLAMRAQFDKAFASLDEAIALAASLKAEGKLAFLYNNYGFWLRENGKTKESITYFERALAIDERMASKKDIAFDLRNLGLSTLVLGHTSLAQQQLERSLAISQELGITYNTIYCHFGLADIALKAAAAASEPALKQAAKQKARKHFQEAQSEAEGKNLLEFRWKALAANGQIDLNEERPSEALPLLSKAIELIELSPPGLKRQSSPTGLSSELGTQSVYELYIASLMALKKPADAWVAAEKAKLRRMVDSLGNDKLPLSHPHSGPLVAAFRSLQEQIGGIRQLLTNPKTPAAQTPGLQRQLAPLVASHQAKGRELHAQDPQAYYLYATEVPSPASIKRLLPANTALVSYQVNEEATYVWLFKNGVMRDYTITIERDLLKRKVEDFRLMVQHYSTTRYLGDDLGRILLTPMAAELSGVESLVIVPHLWLHHLAFAALNDGPRSYLVDRFDLSFLESTAFLPLALASPHKAALGPQASILAFANPPVEGKPALPFAEKEVASMRRYYNQVTAFTGAQARKANLLSQAGSGASSSAYDILHLASHGMFDPTTPSESSLLLGSGDGEKLRALDAFALALSPKLVTLSACESALSVLSSGEDVMSLQRAFFYRGAESVVGSLWRIDDVTSAVVMKRFYRNLAAGLPLARALRQSQLTVKSHFPHPAYWAAFKLTGRYH